MTTLRAHFDGKVIVPDQPLNLPAGSTLEIQVRELKEGYTIQTVSGATLKVEFDPQTGFPVIQAPPGSKMITAEDVRAALEDFP